MSAIRPFLLRIVLGVTMVVFSGVALLAQQGDQTYVQMKPGDPLREVLPATPLVFTAYAFVWVALVVYVLLIARRLATVERELADLRSKPRAPRA